jgi:hypothetical protein
MDDPRFAIRREPEAALPPSGHTDGKRRQTSEFFWRAGDRGMAIEVTDQRNSKASTMPNTSRRQEKMRFVDGSMLAAKSPALLSVGGTRCDRD